MVLGDEETTMKPLEPVTVAIVGAGGRGAGYADFASKHPDRMRVVAVAEPRDSYRQRMESLYSIPSEHSVVA